MQLPGYQIHQEIGHGGMARVYLATQSKFGRQVAVKVVTDELARDPKFRQRFIAESRINARMTHPNIVRVYDVGAYQDTLYLVMEYISGGDLNARLERGMHLQELMRVINDVGRALDYAHRQGFVHRDIKPENILFRDDGSAVLSDFGIAQVMDSSPSISRAGTVVGTPQYMSPEQAAGKALDARSDIYSLGVVFYRMLTGDVPFKAQTEVSVGLKHLQEPVPRLPNYLAPFQEVVDRAMAKKPAMRYQSGAELATALEAVRATVGLPDATVRSQAVTTQEIRAAGSSLFTTSRNPDRNKRNTRRRRRGALGPVVSVAILVLLISGVSAMLIRQPDLVTRLLAGAGLTDDPVVQEAWNAARSLREDPNQGLATIVAGYRRVLSLDPTHQGAQRALESLASQWEADIDAALAQGNLRLAETKLAESNQAFPREPSLDTLAERVTSRRHAERLLVSTQALLQSHGRSDIPSATAAIQAYQEVLRLAPDNAQARQELDALGQHFATLAATAADAGNAEQAIAYLDRASAANSSLPELAEVRDKVRQAATAQSAISDLLVQADAYRAAGALLEPAGANAAEIYHQVLATDPDNAVATEGLNAVASTLMTRATELLGRGELDAVQSLVDRSLAVGLDTQAVNRLKARLDGEVSRRNSVSRSIAEAEALLGRGYITEPPGRNAVMLLREVERLDPGNSEARTLRRRAGERLVGVAQDAHAAGIHDDAMYYLELALSVTPDEPAWQALYAEWQENAASN